MTLELLNVQQKMDAEKLESLVDSIGLVNVVELLANICFDKVQHLEENWQESPKSDAVKVWTRNGRTLNRVSVGLWRHSWER